MDDSAHISTSSCEFLDIEPRDFFEEDVSSPDTFNKAIKVFRSLSPKQLELLIAVAEEMK